MPAVPPAFIHPDCTCGNGGGGRDACKAPKNYNTVHRGPLTKLRAEAQRALNKTKAQAAAKEKSDKESKEKADKDAKEKSDKDAKEKSDKESKEKSDKEAKEKSNKDNAEAAGGGGGGGGLSNATQVALIPSVFNQTPGYNLTRNADGSVSYVPVNPGMGETERPPPQAVPVSFPGFESVANQDGTYTLRPVPPSQAGLNLGGRGLGAGGGGRGLPDPKSVTFVGGEVPIDRALTGMMSGIQAMAGAIETLADVSASASARAGGVTESKVVLPLTASGVAQQWSKWCDYIEQALSHDMAEVRIETLLLEMRSAFAVDKLRPESAMAATATEALKTVRATLALCVEDLWSEEGLSAERKARYVDMLSGPGALLVTAARSESHSMESAGALGARLHAAAAVEPTVTAAAAALPAALRVPSWKRDQERRRSFRARGGGGAGGRSGGGRGGGRGNRGGYGQRGGGYEGGGRKGGGRGSPWDGSGVARDRRNYGEERSEWSDSGGKGRGPQQGGGGGGGMRR